MIGSRPVALPRSRHRPHPLRPRCRAGVRGPDPARVPDDASCRPSRGPLRPAPADDHRVGVPGRRRPAIPADRAGDRVARVRRTGLDRGAGRVLPAGLAGGAPQPRGSRRPADGDGHDVGHVGCDARRRRRARRGLHGGLRKRGVLRRRRSELRGSGRCSSCVCVAR